MKRLPTASRQITNSRFSNTTGFIEICDTFDVACLGFTCPDIAISKMGEESRYPLTLTK